MRFQFKSAQVINFQDVPEIKEINDKKLIEIIYPLTNLNNDIENSMSEVNEEDSNLSDSEDNEGD